jgi:hypothetical protein
MEVTMRFLVKASTPTEGGNVLMKKGKFGETIQGILSDLKPEAVYFTADGGKRTAYLVMDLPDASHLPRVAEPFFLAFNGTVEFYPIMSPEDLMKAGPHIENAVKKYS